MKINEKNFTDYFSINPDPFKAVPISTFLLKHFFHQLNVFS